MLAINDILQAFARLSAGERLIWIDSWVSAFIDFQHDHAGKCEGETARTLVELGRMLQVMREDLAMIDDPTNRAIIARICEIISLMQTGGTPAAIIPYFEKPRSILAARNKPLPEPDLLPSS